MFICIIKSTTKVEVLDLKLVVHTINACLYTTIHNAPFDVES